MLFLGVAVAVIALFVGLAAGPASAGPDVSARVPPGKSGDPGPKPAKGGDAQNKKSGEGPKPGSAARPGKDEAKKPHAGKGPPGHRGGHADRTHTDETKVESASRDKDAGGEKPSPAAPPHEDETVDTPTTVATTTPPLRDPDRDIRTLSNGTAGVTASFASERADPADPGPAAPAAGPPADAPASPDPVIGGALGPPLLGAGPTPSRWAPFVPALDEPAFPAILLAALGLFLAVFGRGDRRDPKLVEAVVDDRAQDVDFS